MLSSFLSVAFALTGLCLFQSEARVLDIENWVHLTYPLSPETPVYKAIYEPLKINEEKSVATDVFDVPKLNGSFVSWRFLEFYEHTGTHVDAPRHFCEHCKTEDELTWEELTGPLVVIDVRYLSSGPTGKHIEAEDLQNFVDQNGAIESGSFVIMFTGWGKYYWDGGDKYIMEQTCIGETAIDWLLENARDVKGIGIDGVSPECMSNIGFRLHTTLLPEGKLLIENVKSDGLEKLPPKGSHLMIFPMHLKDGTGSPARLIAVMDGVSRLTTPALLLIFAYISPIFLF
ncbi:isatin hydrolase-like [Convolutriloba macropyga]|uniref:isatin hydrolase-like n=1 Tax=Convolutriloba macropyga TaxID=536237 RepID=UPI003F5259BF